VIVAHDRALLRSCCDEFHLVEEGQVRPFDGDLEDYARLVGRKQAVRSSEAGSATTTRRDERRERADQRSLLAPLRREIQRIEKHLERLESERGEIETALADSSLYDGNQSSRIAGLTSRRASIALELRRPRKLAAGAGATDPARLSVRSFPKNPRSPCLRRRR
jgi:ATP-binding cassette subfamily F protein 3